MNAEHRRTAIARSEAAKVVFPRLNALDCWQRRGRTESRIESEYQRGKVD